MDSSNAYSSSEIKSGFFVLVAIVLLLVLTFVVGGYLKKGANEWKVQFGYLSGLSDSAPVYYAGREVGKVDSIQILPGEARPVLVTIKVSDTGSGMSEEIRAKIFDPYFTTKKQGNGLGLATSYSIVRKHDGDITVNSVVDQGTRLLPPWWMFVQPVGRAPATIARIRSGRARKRELRRPGLPGQRFSAP